MKASLNRRGFLKAGSACVAGAAVAGLGVSPVRAAGKVVCSTPAAEKMGWLVGAQLYTFRRFAFYEALEMIAALGLRHVEPCFFLGLDKARPKLKVNEDLSPEVRKELKGRLSDRGIAMSVFYANLGADKDRARKIFEFSQEMGAGAIVAEPSAQALDTIEPLCDEFQIDLAIHNHPRKEGYEYWKPENVMAICKGRSKRIGTCPDTGHWTRSGLDPVACLKTYEGRIRNVHLKDALEKGNTKSRDVPLGEGAGNYAAVLAELKRQDYRGAMTVEYEHDSPQLVDDVRRCAAFVEKQAKQLGA
ncbi:MAG TPA: sugar phosphate isomerase/epimerase family protein [Phycisphaerae bacterium]|nr:sugar phosphate isomerase/epimerase family protein [Phycisphaerae bacterium]